MFVPPNSYVEILIPKMMVLEGTEAFGRHLGHEGGASRMRLVLFKKKILVVLGLCCCMGFSLVVVSRGCSLVTVPGLLIVMASVVAEQGI